MAKWVKKSKKKINIVYILDSSGSMRSNDKYTEGVSGLISEVKELSSNGLDVDYTFTLVEFDDHIATHFYKENNVDMIVEKLEGMKIMGGMTSLNDAIGKTLSRLKQDHVIGENTVISILTDGGENTSKEYKFVEIQELIAKLKDSNFVTTFIGTEYDTQAAVRNYGIDRSNTLTHDNTSGSFQRLSKSRSSSMAFYSSNVASGASADSLERGFFSNVQE